MWYNYYVVGGQAPGPDPKGHEMKLSAEVRADAKKYNSEYDLFEGYSIDTGESRYYSSYGVAYRYTSDRVYKGENMCILGHRWNEEAQDYEVEELCAC